MLIMETLYTLNCRSWSDWLNMESSVNCTIKSFLINPINSFISKLKVNL